MKIDKNEYFEVFDKHYDPDYIEMRNRELKALTQPEGK